MDGFEGANLGSNSMDDYDDVEIALRISYGEADAVRELVRLHGPWVKGYLKAKYRDIPEEDRELALRIAAYKAVKRADTFDDGVSRIGAWFLLKADNTVKDMLKLGRTAYCKNLDDHIGRMTDYGSSATAPKDEADEQLDEGQLDDLRQAIEELTPQLRRVVLADLAAGGKANTTDLGKEIGVASSSIRQYRKRAREDLYEIMKKKGHTETKRRARR